MGIGENFSLFCSNISISADKRESISYRYKRITRQLNIDFRGLDSDTANSFYLGSYGRGTAISSISDLDMAIVLPYETYKKYNEYLGNGQSALLQAVRTSMRNTYPTSEISGDGQVVVIQFTDNIIFEVLPCFLNTDGSYTYPNSNGGGAWKTTNPKAEIEAMSKLDGNANGNLKRLAKMARAWKARNNVPISGWLIDTFAYKFIDGWTYKDKSFLYYDWLSRDFFGYLASQDKTQNYWTIAGSGAHVYRTGSFEYKAKQAHDLAVQAIAHYDKSEFWSGNQKWREIYGTNFPS